MKELIQMILSHVPRYLVDFGLLLSGPKRFIAQRNTKAEKTLNESLIFFGISLSLAVVATMPLMPPETNLWQYLTIRAIMALLIITLSAIALRLAWRLMGGKATVRSFFVTDAYFFGVLSIVLTIFELLYAGVFKVLAPNLYEWIRAGGGGSPPIPDLTDNVFLFVLLPILLTYLLFIVVWPLVTWGAYRELNDLSKSRSFLAFMVTGVFSCVTTPIIFFVAAGLAPSSGVSPH